MSKTKQLDLRFVPTRWDRTVHDICNSWRGTPHQHDRCEKGIAVDCIHFVAAVLDELYALSDTSKRLRLLPPDACVHNREGVRATARVFLETYNIFRSSDGTAQSGDIVVIGPSGAEAAHIYIVGLPGHLWHAAPNGVDFTGIGIPDDFDLIAVYRCADKRLWE